MKTTMRLYFTGVGPPWLRPHVASPRDCPAPPPKHRSTPPPGDPSDPGARARLGAAGADVRVQAHEEAAPEAADGAGEQAEGGDGRAPAEAGQGAGEPEEQLLLGGRQAVQEAPGHPGEGGGGPVTQRHFHVAHLRWTDYQQLFIIRQFICSSNEIISGICVCMDNNGIRDVKRIIIQLISILTSGFIQVHHPKRLLTDDP